jgi:hypothetical protein
MLCSEEPFSRYRLHIEEWIRSTTSFGGQTASRKGRHRRVVTCSMGAGAALYPRPSHEVFAR